MLGENNLDDKECFVENINFVWIKGLILRLQKMTIIN